MFLRLKYFLKTDWATQRADSKEFATARNELLRLANKYYEARGRITGKVGSWETYCLECFSVNTYKCKFFSEVNPCSGSIYCVRRPVNAHFVNISKQYKAQKKLVDEFWARRMRERVNGKQK